MFMFNTVRPLAMYENAVGAERFEFGFPVIQARIDASGVLTHSIIRAGGWPVTSAALMNELRKVGLPVRVEKRMQSWQRAHAAFAAPFLGLAYRAKHVNGGKVAWADARDFARALDEGFRFFRALGEDGSVARGAPRAFHGGDHGSVLAAGQDISHRGRGHVRHCRIQGAH